MRTARRAALVALLLTPTAVAQSPCPGATAEELLSQGVQRRRGGDPDGARVCFEAAYRNSGSPRAAGQLGFAEQQLHRWADAATHLRAALSHPDDPWVTQYRTALEGSLAAVTREFEPQTPPPPPPPPPPPLLPPPVTPPRTVSPLLWVGGGVAVAAAATAIGLGVSGNAEQADYDARCVDRVPDSSTDCRALQRGAQAALDDRALAVNVLWGTAVLGAGVAVAGVVLTLRSGRRAAAARSPTLAAGPRWVAVTFTW